MIPAQIGRLPSLNRAYEISKKGIEIDASACKFCWSVGYDGLRISRVCTN